MITQGNIIVFRCQYRRAERELAYYNSLSLVAWIDNELVHGTTHFRNKAGALLQTLDRVVDAILADELAIPGRPATADDTALAAAS